MDVMKTRFSKGNRKLSQNVLVWNLPRELTCPGAGDCKKWCYEIKIERMYKNVFPFRMDNYRMSKQTNFGDKVVRFLSTRKEPYVRIHASGDFYNQTYLNKWKSIARQVPTIGFYCFTKSLKLDLWSNLPPNMQIMQSTGGKWDDQIDWSRATNRAAKPSDVRPPVHETQCTGSGCGDGCTLCIPQSNIHLVEDLHY